MAVKIAIANKKGGIGKTTTALSLTYALQKMGKRVLLIDTDPQKSASGVYGAAIGDEATLADIMYGGMDAKEVILKRNLGDIIVSDEQLETAEQTIPSDADRFYHLSDSCQSLENEYDYIIIDCPPGNGVMLGNVLSYVNHVIIPITCDKFGIQGLAEFKDVMDSYKKRINPSLDVLGVLMVMYKGRQNLTKELEEGVIPKYVDVLQSKLFNTTIRTSVKIQESQALGLDLYDYAPLSTAAIDYAEFAKEVVKMIEG